MPPTTIFVARHGERLDYVWRARGENWQQQAERPWDTPLSEPGVRQGAAMGRAVERQCRLLGCALPTAVYSSPLVRCVETAAAAAEALGVAAVRVEPAVAEGMLEEWYRSWAMPSSDSTWGGPRHQEGPVDPATLHPAARGPAHACHPAAADLAALGLPVDLEYAPFAAAGAPHAYTWGSFEDNAALKVRMGAFADHVAATRPGETSLVVSHGGPTSQTYLAMTKKPEGPNCGYCAL